MFRVETNQVTMCSLYHNFFFSSPPPILCISLLLLLLPFFLLLCFSFPLLINYVCHLQLTECCTICYKLLLSLFPVALLASQSFPFVSSPFLTLNLSPSPNTPHMQTHIQKLNTTPTSHPTMHCYCLYR